MHHNVYLFIYLVSYLVNLFDGDNAGQRGTSPTRTNTWIRQTFCIQKL